VREKTEATSSIRRWLQFSKAKAGIESDPVDAAKCQFFFHFLSDCFTELGQGIRSTAITAAPGNLTSGAHQG